MILQHITNKKFADEIKRSGFLLSNGESGRGVYFFDSRAFSVRKYYLKNTLKPVIISVRPKEKILDLTHPNIKSQLKVYAQKYFDDLSKRMGGTFIKPKINDFTIYKTPYLIESFIYNFYPKVKIYSTRHFGHNLPDSKQYIVKDINAIEIIKISRNRLLYSFESSN